MVNCAAAGMAEAPEWLVTLTIVTNQFLEHLDQGGWWGNLADVLLSLDQGGAEKTRLAARRRLLANLPAPGVLVVPAEWALVKKYLASLSTIAGLSVFP